MNSSSNSARQSSRMRNGLDESGVAKAYHRMEEVVEDRPISAVMLSFGIGLGIGFAIGGMIAASATTGEPHKRAAERMGQQLLDALARVVPRSVSEHFT